MLSSSSTFVRIAHRGGALLAPENTLGAFRQALTFPIDMIEFDVQMTCDGHAIVFHDHTVDRVTDGSGNLLDLSLQYLRSLNAAAHFSGGWPQRERIPTVCEALTHIGPYKSVCIEIKAGQRDTVYGRYPGIVEAIVEELVVSGMVERAVIISFDWQILASVKMLMPELPIGMIVGCEWWQKQSPEQALLLLLSQAEVLQCQWVNMDYRVFTPEILASLHQHGLKLGLWTVNILEELQYLADAGVDSLTTDRPDLFTQVI